MKNIYKYIKRMSVIKTFYENGEIETITVINENIRKVLTYYPGEVLSEKKSFFNNKLHGKYISYGTDGRKVEHGFFRDGILEKYKMFDINGDINATYKIGKGYLEYENKKLIFKSKEMPYELM
jgi:antitoxin component YwqK of YwqJK toxin-antitoxin module